MNAPAETVEEVIRWHRASTPPNDDRTVLVYAPNADPPVWLGSYDGAFWFAVDANDYEDDTVHAWAEIPAGGVP